MTSDGLVLVTFTKDHRGYTKGQRLRVDPRSAESLVKARVAKTGDAAPAPAPAPAPVVERENVPAEDLTPPE